MAGASNATSDTNRILALPPATISATCTCNPSPPRISRQTTKQHPSPGGRKPADDFVMPPRSPRCSSAASRARNHEIVRTTRCPNPPGCPNPPSARVPEPPAAPRRQQHRVVGSRQFTPSIGTTHTRSSAPLGPWAPQIYGAPEAPAASVGSTPEEPPAATGWNGVADVDAVSQTQNSLHVSFRSTI